MNDVDLVERVGTHVVAKIKGDLQETFDRLDEDGDGRRLLCVELEKTARNTGPAVADCVFDESLAIDGESVV